MAGRVEKKNPTIGRSRNSNGKSKSLNLDSEESLGLFLKSIITIARRVTKHEVKINPPKRGRVYPIVVLEKTGFTMVTTFAAIVIINQLTGQRKWSSST